jgi:CxxC motif-containing protein (DUF1111 family)
MKWSGPAWYLGAALLVFVPVGLRVLSWSEEEPVPASPEDVRAGGVLFTHEWQPKDPLCNGGDGLGPVFNAASCGACHRQGGLGGGGGLEHNVTVFVDDASEPRAEGVIHARATNAAFQETLTLLDRKLPAISQPSLKQIIAVGNEDDEDRVAVRMRVRRRPIERPQKEVAMRVNGPEDGEPLELRPGLRLGQRNTPALFGAGLIDAIPDRVILANARRQRLRYGMAPGDTEHLPVGRPLRLEDGRIGKFGWKAQAARLSEFVQAACANELGLSNPGHSQARSLARPDYKPVGLDLTQKQCDQMTAFVASLKRPVEQLPADPAGRAAAHQGRQLFNKVGCASCHTPDLGSVAGLYSDLLLHRMGQDLEAGGSSYGGESVPDRSPSEGAQADEWRTPPLWGVADSAPYMHDGRAATLEQAIRMHAGQGSSARKRFAALTGREQAQVIEFLKTLRAPSGRGR